LDVANIRKRQLLTLVVSKLTDSQRHITQHIGNQIQGARCVRKLANLIFLGYARAGQIQDSICIKTHILEHDTYAITHQAIHFQVSAWPLLSAVVVPVVLAWLVPVVLAWPAWVCLLQ
jgi:hypothetical protein